MKRTRFLLLALAASALLAGTQAFANDLTGDNVTVNYLYPDIGTVFQNLGSGNVTASGFTVNSFGQHNYTVYPAEITLTNVAGFDITFLSASFNGYQLINNSGSPAITGVTVAFSDVAGFTSSDVTWNATNVWLNMQSLVTTPGLDIQLDLQFGPAPEPATSSLLFFELLGAAALFGLKTKAWRRAS